jgi:hypothetical protein
MDSVCNIVKFMELAAQFMYYIHVHSSSWNIVGPRLGGVSVLCPGAMSAWVYPPDIQVMIWILSMIITKVITTYSFF